ncbi:MAG: (2Fe-2S)-binding protein [Gammaproteobacteria bacterium]|jgi:carbon-monoxide dehydrogenase small subunit|nr:(2Fe-2S)-binding protein [Gammaproteobacteria bacterium]HJP35121.1 (2Fe-2S)-binding protein [Gammaproteobacteria bacterium]
MQNEKVTVTVNGTRYERVVEPRRLASDFIRHDLFLTGTHVGCEHGTCGCCNILLNGETVRSCLLFAVQLDGAEVRTIEGLGTIDEMHPVQEAFMENQGLQCGFCTPGMLLSAVELLENNPDANLDDIRSAVSSNLCRCTGYQSIVESVVAAAEKMRGGER